MYRGYGNILTRDTNVPYMKPHQMNNGELEKTTYYWRGNTCLAVWKCGTTASVDYCLPWGGGGTLRKRRPLLPCFVHPRFPPIIQLVIPIPLVVPSPALSLKEPLGPALVACSESWQRRRM